MTLGIPIQIKAKTILKHGYKLVPTHTYSNLKVDKQFVTGWKNGKRWHILKVGGQYFIHLDYFEKDREGHKTKLKGDEIKQEIKRLKI